mmetsp:Transcript_9990/g.25287  ORF Transcript_9990/g.25287 Transcript_9990/m.25287 type:complete len:162 (-) Transcript_9990:458-943(-)
MVRTIAARAAPPRWAVLAVAAVLAISGMGTFTFWAGQYLGYPPCVECVPFGLSTFRFLYWPLSDMFLCGLCLFTSFALVRRARFAYLAGVTLGFLFVFMALLAWSKDLATGMVMQPQYLNLWFAGWGSFMLWFMHNFRSHWQRAAGGLPITAGTQRKRGAI